MVVDMLTTSARLGDRDAVLGTSALDLEVLPGLLHHFMVSLQGDAYHFCHKTTGDEVEVPVRTANELFAAGKTPIEVFEILLAQVICGDCGIRLWPGEVGRCVPCEATQIMDWRRTVANLELLR